MKNNKSNKRSTTGIIILIIVVLIIAGGCGYGVMKYKSFTSEVVNSAQKRGEPQTDITITVEKGSSVREIASLLQQNGVIDSEMQFIYLCKTQQRGGQFQPGEYTFNNYMTYGEIADLLESGRVDEEYTTFTIKEGEGVKEIAKGLEEAGIVSAEEFLEACNSREYDYSFIADIPQRDNLLEGYLFPDTYYFTKEADCDEIINKLLSRFDEVFNADMRAQARDMGYSIDDIVIIASIIEGEVRYAPERPTVSAVIYNRLEKGMKLQMDATVLYALGEKKDRVLYSDLEIEDEHNTYYVSGLPIGPIGNPGLDCIKAALNPEDTDYLYYVLEDTESGKHIFTSNYDEFTSASAQYKKELD